MVICFVASMNYDVIEDKCNNLRLGGTTRQKTPTRAVTTFRSPQGLVRLNFQELGGVFSAKKIVVE